MEETSGEDDMAADGLPFPLPFPCIKLGFGRNGFCVVDGLLRSD